MDTYLPKAYLIGLTGLLIIVAILVGRQLLKVRNDEVNLIKLEKGGANASKNAAELYELASVQLRKRLYPQATTTLRKALKQVLLRKEYDDAVGTKYIAGISLNQIPGDPDSIKGENVKGIYWTRPDSSGKEAVRAKRIDETKYTEFVKDLEDTYFKEVYDILSKKFKLGRVRILLKEPRSTLSWHRDPEPRLHIPIITNPGCIMVIEEIAKHLPADGSTWVTNNMKYHNFFNGGEEDRIHLVACLTDYRFN